MEQDNLKLIHKIKYLKFKLEFHENSNFIPRINANKRKIARKQKAFAEKKRLIHDHLTGGQNQPLITEKRKDILGHSFQKLLQELRDETLDPVEVLEAYQVFLREALFRKSTDNFHILCIVISGQGLV